MKLKILFTFLMIPFAAMAANTNRYDNVLIMGNLQYLNGTFTANRVLTSDGAGNYSPQNVVGLNAAFLTNLTTSSTGVTWTGQGTHIMDLGLNFSIFVTNGSSPSFTTINGMTPANIVTNVTGDAIFPFTGTAGHSYVLTPNYAINVTNGGSYSFGTINGMTPATFVTNVASTTTGLTVTGQGTHTISLASAAAMTNANNFFLSSVTNTYNGAIAYSNATMLGGFTLNYQTKAANYTNTANDYYISYRSVTTGQPTNFLNSGFSAGRAFIIKDGARAASTTNIVLFPLGGNTISGTNASLININGQSVNVVFDGTSNWEIY